jgi:hypothetical protein
MDGNGNSGVRQLRNRGISQLGLLTMPRILETRFILEKNKLVGFTTTLPNRDKNE